MCAHTVNSPSLQITGALCVQSKNKHMSRPVTKHIFMSPKGKEKVLKDSRNGGRRGNWPQRWFLEDKNNNAFMGCRGNYFEPTILPPAKFQMQYEHKIKALYDKN